MWEGSPMWPNKISGISSMMCSIRCVVVVVVVVVLVLGVVVVMVEEK